MKRLDQVEARTPIDAAHLHGDNTSEFIIKAAGSYYLTGNLYVAKTTGLEVTAAGVTIDLNGFEVRRTANSGGTGVHIEVPAAGCFISNGGIRGFEFGVLAQADDFENQASAGRVVHVTVTSCSFVGISVGNGWQVIDCALDSNGEGIHTGIASTVKSCTVTNGSLGGILAGGTVIGCAAFSNKGVGITAFTGSSVSHCSANQNAGGGIQAFDDCTVSDSAAESNTSTATASGIALGNRGIATRCTASGNANDGISGGSDCDLFDNSVSGNGVGIGVSNGAGIHVLGNANRIHANNTTSNDVGILAKGTGNLIDANHVRNNTGPGIQVTTANGKNVVIRNVAGNNVHSYTEIAAGNNVAPIDTNFSSTNPFANFQN